MPGWPPHVTWCWFGGRRGALGVTGSVTAGCVVRRTKSNQRWMKLRTTVQLSGAIQKVKPPLKREDSFLKRFSTRQIAEAQVKPMFSFQGLCLRISCVLPFVA